MPVTPIAERASRTSSSLNGLMIAVTSFIFPLLVGCALRSGERVGDEADEAVLAPGLALHCVGSAFRVGALHIRAGIPSPAEIPGAAQLPHGVGAEIVGLV